MPGQSSIFRLNGISRRYGALAALSDVSLDVGANEYVSLLGPSGSGKTTLLRVIAGFEAPDAGSVSFEGRDITHVPAHQRGIGFVFQNFALFPHLTVIENVAFGMAQSPTPPPKSEIDARCSKILALVGLTGLERRGVHQISGGQKQRVALARTLVMEPKLVLLDEPLGALDANLRHRMRIELRAIRETLGVTFLHVTGSETEALAMGDRTVVLDQGRIAQFDKPDIIYDAPASPNVAHFLNRFNMFDGSLKGDTFIGPMGSVKVGRIRPGPRPTYCIRYDRTRVAAADASPDGPALPATYIASEYLGPSVMNFFETAQGQVVEVEHHISLGAPQIFTPRTRYLLHWNATDALVFG